MVLSEENVSFISLSFDDGRKDALEAFRNILLPRGVPATFNIPTACADGSCTPESVICATVAFWVDDINQFRRNPINRHTKAYLNDANKIASLPDLEKLNSMCG